MLLLGAITEAIAALYIVVNEGELDQVTAQLNQPGEAEAL
jgi:hypothetical protein